MTNFIQRFLAGEEGGHMVEYALIIAFIASAVVTAVRAVSTAVSGSFNTISTSITPTGS